jgi:uncharacterized protein YciI
MNEEEKKIMQAHSAYLCDWMNKGRILLFGPVLDPLGAYGLGIAAVDHETRLQKLLKMIRLQHCISMRFIRY